MNLGVGSFKFSVFGVVRKILKTENRKLKTEN